LRMPRCDGVEATRRITRRWPATQVLVLTTFDEDELVFQSIEAGAAGYLLKDVGSDALADAVRAANRGESPIQPSVARKLLGRLRSSSSQAGPPLPDASGQVTTRTASSDTLTGADQLTARDVDVLRLLAAGATNHEIAQQLCLTDGTVKNYVSTLLGKT